MKTFTLNLDGQAAEAREGETILQLARRLGVEIPALCYDPRLPPYASCFVCIVEVEGRRGVVPACATKCEAAMVIRTKTENIVKLRRMALELLLSNHHGDCVAPCSMACPAGIDIRSYLAEVAQGKYHRAVRIIKERNPFPSVCGRICPHRCEDACRRHLVDDPVAINLVKRFVADLDRATGKPWKPELAPRNGKTVAVIGGGPGGMSAAYWLVQLGYEPTVFESMPKAGGMLRYGVPDYRLPQDVLDAEIAQILDLGVKLECGKAWGRDFHLDDLRRKGFTLVHLRALIDTLREYFRVRLFEATGEGGAVTLLTDGRDIYVRTLDGRFFNLLKDPTQPLLVIGEETSFKVLASRARPRRKKKQKSLPD